MEAQLISVVDGIATKCWCSSWWRRCVLVLVGYRIVNWRNGERVVIDVVANCCVVCGMVVGELYFFNKLIVVVIAINHDIVGADSV